jgi:hypothetical protein
MFKILPSLNTSELALSAGMQPGLVVFGQSPSLATGARMHYETTNLPADVHEVFCSDNYYYASSSLRTAQGKPKFVGCGMTREEAFANLREEVANAGRKAAKQDSSEPVLETSGELARLSGSQRQSLARNLVHLRQTREVSQLHVAQQALGFTKSHAAVSRLERAELTHVPLVYLERLAGFYATTVVALFLESTSRPSAPSATGATTGH